MRDVVGQRAGMTAGKLRVAPDRGKGRAQFVAGVGRKTRLGGMGVFYWEPEVYSPFDDYASGAWQTNYEPTTALNGFLDNTGTVVTPYLQVSGGAWQQTATVTVSSTSTSVNLGPQPASGGSWKWTGPNGYSSTSRQINNIPLTSNTNGYCLFVASYTNSSGVVSSQPFTIYVS